MTPLPFERYLNEVTARAALLETLLAGAAPQTPLPTCPGWTLTELSVHVRGNLATLGGAAAGNPAREVPPRLTDCAEDFAAALRAAGPDAQTESWGLKQPARYWARRAAHDLTVHHADAALALGAPLEVAPDLAADGLDELLEMFAGEDLPGLRGLAGRSLHLHATDAGNAEWLIDFTGPSPTGSGGFTWRHAHQKATTAVRAPMTALLLLAYRRYPADSEDIQILGETAVLDTWLDHIALT
ncbi:maleylpyruvate isomerase family mycothiol-dependent enzyme [Streptomyces aidingensis]|uniref:TIGR03083 family protein n=1 Tax=Streptomyces aidingensis TaxID=910347 RepID=A0A1I1MB09_9ACTN|nr:maleylpyruvate isomerase family mycothiol-dependent enzyme [Streptomyces aidingensis]SFC82335.1 TIGR03083 family protein [Streptomyces aidingensis]